MASLAVRATDDALRVRVATMRFDSSVWGGRFEQCMTVLLQAENEIHDPAGLDELLVRRALMAFGGGFTAVAIELLEPALGRIDGEALSVAAFTGGWAYCQAGRTGDALAIADRGYAAARALPTSYMVWYPVLHRLMPVRALTWAGHPVEAESRALRCYQEALADEAVETPAWCAYLLSDCYLMQGRAATAARWAREAVAVIRSLDRIVYLHDAMLYLAFALTLEARVDEAEAVLDDLDANRQPLIRWKAADFPRARAWWAAANGDRAAARQWLDEAVATARSSGDFYLESAALHDLARFGWATDAAPRLAELAGTVEGPLAATRAAYAAALASGDAPALEAASAAFEQMPAWLFAAEAAADAAVAWRQVGESRKAIAVERRARGLAERCEGATTPALQAIEARSVLTQGERDVAVLAAAGRTNPQIAEALHLSRGTVENYLHRVYEKLGITSRAELADAMK